MLMISSYQHWSSSWWDLCSRTSKQHASGCTCPQSSTDLGPLPASGEASQLWLGHEMQRKTGVCDPLQWPSQLTPLMETNMPLLIKFKQEMEQDIPLLMIFLTFAHSPLKMAVWSLRTGSSELGSGQVILVGGSTDIIFRVQATYFLEQWVELCSQAEYDTYFKLTIEVWLFIY